ncbi:hypothetical protein G7Y31_10575 [Corynebacterium lizhenjunii]|uniref:Uncharacterized protein n=1 Tax=Corynebacterium lizhenjunii TaxID=2709394 RepID=A0A7T0KER7_9CORY|nr:hypothetical protein [Corynebacterium lizhenjunii]QPK78940.1 hypothetical protein G7Y31_10575 [Corynebacterium lizhenjunii]
MSSKNANTQWDHLTEQQLRNLREAAEEAVRAIEAAYPFDPNKKRTWKQVFVDAYRSA